ncbi:FliM/FliN family flagellar motor switch protein [Pantoea sp. SORGH_AS_0659]|uniref:FliM/FliN family flagellar motor switch protein n=1 Tax=Pantoea sp. SORGH_AS_0659 TaxID=3062597 RepID=UPI002861923F|nr:FliM/FliN family flagellar motor switch protein [Pantoea sp. SORGH_AS_0659]MDR6352524.1 type III secretion protein Q [Pantoea sp. SORGH_AS_0659]
MKGLPLRHLDQARHRLYQLKHHLNSMGYPVSESHPPAMTVLSRAQTASGAQVLIDLRAWCYHEMKELSSFADGYLSADDIRHLFQYSNSTLDIFSGTPLQEKLYVCNEVVHSPLHNYTAMLSLDTEWGPVWITEISDTFIRQIKGQCHRYTPLFIPLPVSLVIGESKIEWRYLRRVNPGDVLLIEKYLNVLKTGGYRLGQYRYQEEYVVIDELYEHPATELDMHEQSVSDPNATAVNIAQIPVRLEFVIHEKIMTFGNLAHWSEHDILPVNNAESGVLIKANGVIIGKGELVDLNGRIAVEILELNRDAVDGK